jgi:chromosomal replication initiation ATPase DnaA
VKPTKPGLKKAKRIIRADMPDAEKATYDILDVLRERGWLKEIEARCASMHVSVTAVAGRTRYKSVARARSEVWRWLYVEQRLSYPEIGAIFGRDHTTIMSAVHGCEQREGAEVERVAAWLEAESVSDEDPRSFVDVVDRSKMAEQIRKGDWR